MRATIGTSVLPILVAGCALETQDAERRRAPIVDGMPTTGDPAVVFLSLGGGSCSGTLVSPKVVLTARHCVEGVSASWVEAFFGSNADGAGTWIQADDVEYHSWADVGVVALSEPGPTAPIPMNDRAFTSGFVGDPVRIVGFGVTGEWESDSGLKREGMTSVDDYDDEIVYVGGSGSKTCYGDSGGPYFMTFDGVEHVAGITSFGTSICESGLSGGVRVDPFVDWVNAYIAEHDDPASCAGDGRCATGCPAPDPDCPCAGDGFCTAACPATPTDPDCDGCGAGDGCRADCPALDTDCCAADGSCNAACGATDPDCVMDPPDPGDPGDPGDPSDPGDDDPIPVDPEEEEPHDGHAEGGCAMVPGDPRAEAPLLLLLVAVLLRRRR